MFSDIFTSFDPLMASNTLPLPISLFWLMNSLILYPLLPTTWMSPSHLSWLYFLLLQVILPRLSSSRSHQFTGWSSIISSLFIFLILFNLMSLVPYVFSLTSHLLFTFSFGLTLWLSLILSSIFSYPMKFIAMLLPGGAPSWLNPFLVLVESSSASARPITLSFRLAANMSAGHVVIILLATFAAKALMTSLMSALFIFLPSQMGYILFEMGICFIQAFIFCLLLSIYADDHP